MIANIIQVEDSEGNLLAVDRSAQQTTDFEYNELGNEVKTTFGVGTPAPSYTMVRYDSFSRITAEMQQTSAAVSAEWSEVEKSFIVVGSNPAQRIPTKLYEYDSQGRLSAVELPAVPDPNNSGQLTRPHYEYGYDAQGNQTLIRDPLGHETRFTFDARRRQLTRTLPSGFGPDGILGTGDDGTLSKGDFSERFVYDDRGRQLLHVSFEGVVTEMVYDDSVGGAGQIAEKWFYLNEAAYAGGSGTPSETWTYTYDEFGREVAVDQNDGSTARTVLTLYDDEGRISQVDSPEGVITYDYNDLGRKTATKVFAAGADPAVDTAERVTNYAYDSLGRLKTVSENLDPASTADTPLDTSYSYDLVGNLDRTNLPNGVVTDYTYDDLNRLNKMTHFAADATPDDLSDNEKLSEFDYTLRADGKRTAVTETFWLDDDSNPATPATPHVSQIDWVYDAIGRLTEEQFDHFDDALDQTEHFAYDLVGNRESMATDKGNNAAIDEAITYLYDANDRLVSEELDSNNDGHTDQTTTYDYDHTQQTSKSVVDAVDSPLSAVGYSYDLQGRMSQVKTEGFTSGALGSRERVTFDYDATGIRVSSLHEVDTVLDPNTENWTLNTRIEFLVDHHNFTGYQQTIKEAPYDDQGNLINTVEYTIGHDEVAQTVTDDQGNTTTQVFGHDGHGSIRVLYDLAGAFAQFYAFDAYGNMMGIHEASGQFVSADASAALTTLLYSGEHFDAKINQQYLRARFYDATTGRFNRLDPFFGNLHSPQSLHEYAYVHGDPIMGTDPTGLQFNVQSSFATSTVTGRLLATTIRIINPTFRLARYGFSATVIGRTFVARLLFHQTIALAQIVVKSRFKPIGMSLLQLSEALNSVTQAPNESPSAFAERQDNARLLARDVKRLANSILIEWRDVFEAVVGPFTDGQMGAAWNLFLPAPTSLVTGRYRPFYVRAYYALHSAYVAHAGIKDGIDVLPGATRARLQNAGLNEDWFSAARAPKVILNALYDPHVIASSIDALTALIEAGQSSTPEDADRLVESLKRSSS